MDRLLQSLIFLLSSYHAVCGLQVMNCTFTKVIFGYTLPDYTYCMFQQPLFSDGFNWNLANSETSTPETGPVRDHGLVPNGYFAYIDSSMKSNGSYARFASPTFTKPNGLSGGCVQFYYHMYGVDIGTLNVSVYDNTLNGLVINWQRTGDQGNQWLRADLNLNLRAEDTLDLQLIIDAYASGPLTNDNKGDIAIDDIIINTEGQCSETSQTIPSTLSTSPPPSTARSGSSTASPTASTARPTWKCNFEGLNKYCGMLRLSYGASFGTSTKSFRTTTGPSGDHTTGNGHFLWMQGLGSSENSSAIAETPRFDQNYFCFNFYYHMFGSGVDQLIISADVNGTVQRLWSRTGDQGNRWLQGRVPLPRGAIKVVIEAVRGSNADSDIALDDLFLNTTNCAGVTVPAIPTSTSVSTALMTSTVAQPAMNLACNFDSDQCNFYQNRGSDTFDWARANGATYTPDTGPSNDHTREDFQGYYMYIRSSYKPSGENAKMSSGLIGVSFGETACLKFWYHMYGSQIGTLNVKVKTHPAQEIVKSFTKTGNQGNQWKQASLDLTYTTSSLIYLEFEATVVHQGPPMGVVKGEIAIDDIMLTVSGSGSCSDLTIDRVLVPVTVGTTMLPTTTGPTHSTTTTPRRPTFTRPTVNIPSTTPPAVQACTFDAGFCGYQQARNDNFDWSRLNFKTWSSNTGPERDHTTGSGYFAYIEASFKDDGARARLVSPAYSKLSDTGCLSFWYHMWGAEMGTLNVTLQNLNQRAISLFSKSGDQGDAWKFISLQLDLSTSQSFLVIFDGVVKHERGIFADVLGDIAIDDVMVDRGSTCGAVSTGTTTSALSQSTMSSPSSSVSTNPSSAGSSTSSSPLPAGSSTSSSPLPAGSSTSSSPLPAGSSTSSSPLPAGSSTSSSSTITLPPSVTKTPTIHSNTTTAPANATNTTADTAGGFGAQIGTTESSSPSGGLIAGVVVAVIVVMVVAVLGGVIFMRKKQLWLFAPGTKMSVMFSRPSSDYSGLYDEKMNGTQAPQPTLSINENIFQRPNEVSDA